MKNRLTFGLAITFIATSAVIFSCNKNNSGNSGNQQTANSLGTQGDDQTMVSDESENLSNDINVALASQVTTNGDSKTQPISGTTAVNSTTQSNGAGSVNGDLICDATIAFDTASDPRTITITYDGTNCWGNRKRTGSVVISIAAGVHWRDTGAVVNIAVQNMKITRVIDGKSIILNGTSTITNVSGGSLKDLALLQSITHSISNSWTVTFADSAVREWHTAKTRVFTYDNGVVITTTGNHSDGTHEGIAEWGVNRFGVAFTAMILQPMVIRQDCDFRITGGEYQVLRSDNLSTTITFGLDKNGNETTCPGSGSYYLVVVWTDPNGRSYPIILPY